MQMWACANFHGWFNLSECNNFFFKPTCLKETYILTIPLLITNNRHMKWLAICTFACLKFFRY